MLTEYSFWLFKDAIPHNKIVKIKKLADGGGYSDSLIRAKNKEVVPDKEHRDSKVFFSNDSYLYELLVPFVLGANKSAGWKFNVDYFENIQIARYTNEQHYNWHQDGPSDHLGVYDTYAKHEVNYQGKVRKLSLILILESCEEGGKFQIANDDPLKDNRFEPDIDAGDIIVFPSYLWHTSTPVIKGTKTSLAMWCLGPPFV